MTAPCFFVDTNLLVYAHDCADLAKQQQAKKWLTFLWQFQRGRLSTQVLNEFYDVATRKLKPKLDKSTARIAVERLMSWQLLIIDTQVIRQAWAIQDKFGFSWWDSLIVASAQLAGCQYLLSEDLQHQQQLHQIRVINPFLVSPEEIADQT
jgi:predicted nucleic acid-binding protein